MSTPRLPNQKTQYKKLNERLSKYMASVLSIYESLNKEAAKIALSTDYDGTEEFSFDDYPITKDRVQKLQQQFVSDLGGVIMSGTSEEWKRSNLLQDMIADKVLGKYVGEHKGKEFEHYYQKNSGALKAFQQRKDKGLNLSQKLWNQSADYKTELEDILSVSIEKGIDAVTLSKRVSKYLWDFPSMQAAYEEKFGHASRAKNCEYRSIRLARSEINMAYRKAEQERWRQFDFVLGYEIKLSGSHPERDICDTLAGKYPKDFEFLGWHPNCMCYCVPLLMSEDEYFAEDDKELSNIVEDVPEQFKHWQEANQYRIDSAEKRGTLPYFLRDNAKYTSKPAIKKQVSEIPLSEGVDSAMKKFDSVLQSMRKQIDAGTVEGYRDREIRELEYAKEIIYQTLSTQKYKQAIPGWYTEEYMLAELEDGLSRIVRGDRGGFSSVLEVSKNLRQTGVTKKVVQNLSIAEPSIDGIVFDYKGISSNLGSLGYAERLYVDYNQTIDGLYRTYGGREKIQRDLSRMADNSSIYMAIDGKTLEKQIILGDGKFKNSLETGTGTFTIIGDQRAIKERAMFGLADDVDYDQMPKYGFMATKGDMDYHAISGWGYGDVYVEFKPHMKKRATMTIGDSYDGNKFDADGVYLQAAPAVPVSNPSAESVLGTLHASSVKQKEMVEAFSTAKSLSELKVKTYVEAQMYGKVTIDDVDAIFVSSKKHRDALAKSLKKQGLNIDIKVAKCDSRLSMLEKSFTDYDDKFTRYFYSLTEQDVRLLGDYYIDGLCKRLPDRDTMLRFKIQDNRFLDRIDMIKSGAATADDKRGFWIDFYNELDKKDKGMFPKVWWENRKNAYGGWVSDIIDEDLVKRSK